MYYLLRTGTNSARALLRSFLCYVFTYLLLLLKHTIPPFLFVLCLFILFIIINKIALHLHLLFLQLNYLRDFYN